MSNYPVEFRCRNMPVTLERKGSGALFTNPGWTRLEKHIERHKKAGGWANIKFHTPPLQPADVEGFKCVKFADVELFHPPRITGEHQMSLEIALAENTATMKQLIELLKGGIPTPAAEEPKKARKPRGEAPPEAETPKAEAKAETPKAEAKAPEPKVEIEEPKAPAVEYKQISDAITRLAAQDRAKAVEILAGFGVKRGPDLKTEQWADALAALQAALQ